MGFTEQDLLIKVLDSFRLCVRLNEKSFDSSIEKVYILYNRDKNSEQIVQSDQILEHYLPIL